MTKRFVQSLAVVLGGVFVASVSSTAEAQEWLKDRRASEGQGYRAGALEIHPGAAAEVGYDSNYFLRSDEASTPTKTIYNGPPTFGPVGAGVLRITPSLSLGTVAARRTANGEQAEPSPIDFHAALSATYRELFGNDELSKQHNASISATASVGVLPGRPWGAQFDATYLRTIQPTVFGDPDLSFNRDTVGGTAALVAQPHGGTLDWQFGYAFSAVLFEQSEGSAYNNIGHSAFTRGRWLFRPRTALLYDGSISFHSYTHDNVSVLHSSDPVRARIGMEGLVTPRFGLMAMIGYGATFNEASTNSTPGTKVNQYDSPVGQVEATFYPTGGAEGPSAQQSLLLSTISLGFQRDFVSSYLSDFYGIDRGYLKISYLFGGRALISLEGGAGTMEYPAAFSISPTRPADSFTDVRADATIYGEYRFIDSFAVNLTGKYSENFSSTQIPVAPSTFYDLSWRRIEGYIGVRWIM
jgi:hypothetical protein